MDSFLSYLFYKSTYTFNFSEIGLCALKPCYPDTPCTDTPETTPGYKCGDCPIGLEGNGINCTDLDEVL